MRIHKKGNAKWIVGVALAIVLLVISVSLISRGSTNFFGATNECQGECKPYCEIGEVRTSRTCLIHGEEQKGKVCCVSGTNLGQQQRQAPDPTINPQNYLIQPEIHLIRGQSTNFESDIIQLSIEQEYTYKIHALGQNITNCTIMMLHPDTRNKITREGSNFLKETTFNENCDQKELKLNATKEDLELIKHNNNYMAHLLIRIANQTQQLQQKEYQIFINTPPEPTE